MGKTALVSQPTLRDEDAIKHDDSNGRTSDEERLEPLCTNVRDVCDFLSRFHANISG